MNLLLDSFVFIEIFKGSKKGKIFLDKIKDNKTFTAITNLFEVYYRTLELYGEAISENYFKYIKENTEVINLNEEIILEAGKIKIRERLHAMDALTLSCARINKMKLLSGDLHFKEIKDVILVE